MDAKRVIVVALLIAGGAGASPRKSRCFDATPDNTSAKARALFEARHCQGGGVTWAAILGTLARRSNPKARFSVDDEADAARFCSDDAQLLAAVRRDYATINRDVAELRRVMAQTSADELECEP